MQDFWLASAFSVPPGAIQLFIDTLITQTPLTMAKLVTSGLGHTGGLS